MQVRKPLQRSSSPDQALTAASASAMEATGCAPPSHHQLEASVASRGGALVCVEPPRRQTGLFPTKTLLKRVQRRSHLCVRVERRDPLRTISSPWPFATISLSSPLRSHCTSMAGDFHHQAPFCPLFSGRLSRQLRKSQEPGGGRASSG